MRHFALPVALTAALWGSTALAAATPEGAAGLTALFQTYLGAAPGVVTVAPEGDAYGVKIDFTPLLAKLPASDAEASVSPLTFQLIDNGDDTWSMTQDQSFALSVKVPGQADLSLNIANITSAGVFDASLQAFSTSTTKLSDMQVKETVAPTMGQPTDVTYAIASASYDTTAAPGAKGGVDSTVSFSAEGFTETFSLPPMAEGAAPSTLTFRANDYTGSGLIEGLRPDAIYKLVAFFVAHPDKAAIAADQDMLKAIVTGGLPLFEHMSQSATMAGLTAETPVGRFSADTIDVQIEANGLVEKGLVREAFALKGLALPQGLVPDWATDLVPGDVSVDLALSRFDLDAPVRLFLQAADLTKNPPVGPETEQQLLAALLPDGVVDLTIAPGEATAPAFGLGYEGTLSFGPQSQAPAGHARLSLTGIDAIKSALSAAPADMSQQILPALAMAEGMSKPGDNGALLWEIEMTDQGHLLINGTDMSGMAQ